MRLLRAEVHEDDGHLLVAQAPSGYEPLVTADDDVVIVPGDDRLEVAELPERPGQVIELGIADLAGVGWVGVQLVDRNLDDLQLGGGGYHLPSWFPRRAMNEGARP